MEEDENDKTDPNALNITDQNARPVGNLNDVAHNT